MKLIIKEFLSQLKESGELDRLLPDLLSRMKLIPISRPQIGVRQNGVDVAAVGKDENGVKTLYLFVLKVHDLGRADWGSGNNSVRQSLEQIQDVYLRSFVQPEHRDLPVKIVVCSTGDLKQDVTADFNGYAERHSTERLSFEFWSGDRLADLIDRHLLDEYAIDPSERADLRRALALIGSVDYDLRHAYRLLRQLLLADVPVPLSGSQRKKSVRQLRTAALSLEIVFRWGQEEQNLLNAFKVGERCCLWAWEMIRARQLTEYRPALSAFFDIYRVHCRIAQAYFEKLAPYYHTRDGLSVHASENALVSLTIFEQIGVLAEIGLMQVQNARLFDDEEAQRNAAIVADALAAALTHNPSSGSPRYDGHAVDIALALLLLYVARRHDEARNWLQTLANRVTYAFRLSKWFPIATDSLDDLVAMENGELSDEEVTKLGDLSTLLPVIMYWAVIFGMEDVYSELQATQATIYKDCCFQLWFTDEETEAAIYREPAQLLSGATEAPIHFPAAVADLLAAEKRKQDSGAILGLDGFSCMRHGMLVLLMIAFRHFRTPVPPQVWLHLLPPPPE